MKAHPIYKYTHYKTGVTMTHDFYLCGGESADDFRKDLLGYSIKGDQGVFGEIHATEQECNKAIRDLIAACEATKKITSGGAL